jgi:hypothetical protein
MEPHAEVLETVAGAYHDRRRERWGRKYHHHDRRRRRQ